MTKTLVRAGAQGDVLIIPTDAIPETATEVPPENGKHIVTHSETGHHHLIDEMHGKMFADKDDQFICYLQLSSDATLYHDRSFDTHEAWSVPKGDYIVRRQREATPEGFRRAAD